MDSQSPRKACFEIGARCLSIARASASPKGKPSARYVALICATVAHGYLPFRGRVRYQVEEVSPAGELQTHPRNLDGGVIVVGHVVQLAKFLWDYTFFGKHTKPLNENDKSYKRGACTARFTEMARATTKFEKNFSYQPYLGILISWIQYNGNVTVELRPRPV